VRYLLLHGFTGTPDNLMRLDPDEGSVMPELAGHLHTEVTGGYWDEVERLAELAGDCPGLFGYSLGGRLALGILARYPKRFAHAVIVSAHLGLSSDVERVERRDADARFVSRLRSEGLAPFIDAWQALPIWHTQAALAEVIKERQRSQRLLHNPEGLAQSLLRHGLAEMPDLRGQLARVTTPVDVAVGEQDDKFVQLGRELSLVLPNATLTIAPGAGHNLVLERRSLVAQLLKKDEP
jgi:2-succinyl-6-hydroxy-2,4-cyclohexadiene-1-carboxylate synthase